MLASMSKQEVDREAATQLLDRVNRFAEIFWEIKGVETYRATCPYPPSLEVVYPRLG
jgi:nickel superoxide dismutase